MFHVPRSRIPEISKKPIDFIKNYTYVPIWNTMLFLFVIRSNKKKKKIYPTSTISFYNHNQKLV